MLGLGLRVKVRLSPLPLTLLSLQRQDDPLSLATSGTRQLQSHPIPARGDAGAQSDEGSSVARGIFGQDAAVRVCVGTCHETEYDWDGGGL